MNGRYRNISQRHRGREQAQVQKTTILRSIKNGRLTGTKDPLGQWQVAEAELLRRELDDIRADRDQWREAATASLRALPMSLPAPGSFGQADMVEEARRVKGIAQRATPLASSDEERLAVALAEIERLRAELRLHHALDEIEQMLRRCDEVEHLLFLATPRVWADAPTTSEFAVVTDHAATL